ncbi:MAG: DNA polymerase IV, partial [Oscillospiraceae bacterium]|nr:DNA polymerase IV [Oscillospiraceae bacterium]
AAKMASEEKKPDGYFEILSPQAFIGLVIDRDVRVLYTVGAKTAEKLHANGINTVRDIQNNTEKVVSLLGKHGKWLTQLAFGIDDSKVTPYRPENAKSVGREVTFQQDVYDYGVLRDVLLLLSLCVENRARRVGLQGQGVSLKLTYADMRSISRSHALMQTDDGVTIYNEAARMLETVEHRPVRLIGVSLYNLTSEHMPVQLSFYDLKNADARDREREMLLGRLQQRYGLDFSSNLEKIYQWDTLHRTIEYMRKYKRVNLK